MDRHAAQVLGEGGKSLLTWMQHCLQQERILRSTRTRHNSTGTTYVRSHAWPRLAHDVPRPVLHASPAHRRKDKKGTAHGPLLRVRQHNRDKLSLDVSTLACPPPLQLDVASVLGARCADSKHGVAPSTKGGQEEGAPPPKLRSNFPPILSRKSNLRCQKGKIGKSAPAFPSPLLPTPH